MTDQTARSALSTFSDKAQHIFAPLQQEIDKAFNEFSRGLSASGILPASPNMDMVEAPDRVELTVEVPGMKQDDIKIAVEDGILTVSGEKKSEKEEDRKSYRLVERQYGAFSRSVSLPAGVEVDKIQASMTDGVLKISAPRKPAPESRTIKIETGRS